MLYSNGLDEQVLFFKYEVEGK